MEISRPPISTVLLNWNRCDLLTATLESYAATIDVPHELFIVDNASSDDSVAVIKRFCELHPSTVAMFLRENRGGEALNEAIERCTGKLIHISENDIEYLAGWDRLVVDLFESFPALGQLSPFGPFPEDDEIRVATPCVLRHSKGRILYEAHVNLTTTCILRRELIDGGLRIHNRELPGPFLFPDDIRLSTEVKQAGFFAGLAPYYLVHNRGHWAQEFARRESYYRDNYRSKPIGEQGWHARIDSWQKRPHPLRASLLFPDMHVSAEKSRETPECGEPWLWSMFDNWTPEVETIEFVHALVRLLKPHFVLETGSWHGIMAAAIGRALRENGRGQLITIEVDPESFRVTADRIRGMNLRDYVQTVHGSSLDYTPSTSVDFALFDSELTIRCDEFRHFLPALSPGATVLFHDSNSAHRVVGEAVRGLVAKGFLDAMLLPTSRGLAVCRLRDKNPQPPNNRAERFSIRNPLRYWRREN